MLLVTGVNGGLGRLVVEHLSALPGAAGRVVLGTRTPDAPGRAGAELPTRRVDFDDPATLADAFEGVTTLLLISAGYGEDDIVTARHGAAIEAAEKAGVRHVVYTSLSGDGDHLAYALAHRWTERRLAESALPAWTVLRNGLYAELLGFLAAPDADGVITAPLGTGRLAAVARADLAEVAAKVALDPAPHAGRTYELVGEQAIGGAEVARALSTPERPVAYRPAALAEAREAVAASGSVPFQVPMLVGTYSAIAHGFLDGARVRNDLPGLLGRPLRPALAVIAAGAGS